ncbi:MAG: hypothetical protein H7Y12_10575 [Sphingobacteriaceae bacterium]|nr:hypothetical protein [Cytophagaceae bacterium]
MYVDIEDPEILAFLWAMHNHGALYMLIGGAAVNIHGAQRVTQDMDIWVAPTNENRNRFGEALPKIGYTSDELSELYELDFTRSTVFTAWIGKESVDCMNYVHHALNFDLAYEKHLVTFLKEGTPLHLVGGLLAGNESQVGAESGFIRRNSFG